MADGRRGAGGEGGGELPGPASDEERRRWLERRQRREGLRQIRRKGKKVGVTLKQAEALRRQKERERLDKDLTFLDHAGLDRADYAVPADAEGRSMMEELEELDVRYKRAEALEAQQLTREQRALGVQLFKQTAALADTLRAVLGVPEGQSSRWVARADQAEGNAVLARLINWVVHPSAPPAGAGRGSPSTPGRNAYGRREDELSPAPPDNADTQPRPPDFTPGKVGLHQLLCELEFLRAFGPEVATVLDAQKDKRGWLTDLETPLNILCGHWLPAFYSRWMGGRECKPTHNDHARGAKSNADMLFLAAAAKKCGRPGATPYSVYQAYRRWQRVLSARPRGAPLRRFWHLDAGTWRLAVPVSALF